MSPRIGPTDDPLTVVVAGEATIDWNLARLPLPPDPNMTGTRGSTTMSFEPGGAALLGRLVTAIADRIEKDGGRPVEVHTVAVPEQPVPGDRTTNHSYAIWSLHEREAGRAGPKVWRISQPLGVEDALPEVPAVGNLDDDPDVAHLVVIDAGLGARRHREQWPRSITTPEATPWVVLKATGPVAEGLLWEHLAAHHARRLVTVVRANDLRVTQAQISRELSWEQSAQDLLWELTHNPEVKQLSRCRHLIVSFGTSGALLLSRGNDGAPRARLFFDPSVMEEEWANNHPGGMVGYTTCLTAAIAREIMVTSDMPQMGRAITRGLDAMRNLHREGYEVDEPSQPRLRFPADRIADAMAEDATRFPDVPVPEPAISASPQTDRWTILEEVFTEGLEQVARKIILHGPGDIISKVPVAKFGKLLTVDRNEIEGFRSVRSLIAQYARQARPERPLSIAVFGRPGSGKSFGIKQIALTLFPGRIQPLTFNLSQFHDPEQLLNSFHQVRDQSLKGKLPLVFWDEFDAKFGSDELGWLKHFLAPMQDGEFQQGEVTHHIGAAIFVFAGGTKSTMLEFSTQESKAFAAGKGRDFVSRLKGYVDVAGPNPIGNSEEDPHYVIRRAILLRSMLESKNDLFIERAKTRELQIDAGALRAFLRVDRYLHGARSIESVIAMSLLDDRSRFERSCLPSAEQLQIHVTPDFLDIVHGLIIEGRMLRELAEAVHVAYCESMLSDGHTWAEPDDSYLERHEPLTRFVGRERSADRSAPSLVSYDDLPDHVKEQNEDFARDLPNKIESIGYEIVRGSAGGETIPDEVVELLAEQEHDRWTRLKLRQGWSWGAERDDEASTHPDILPWRVLTEEEQTDRYGADAAARIGNELLAEKEKNKDRVLVRTVANLLAANGYRVVKRSAEPEKAVLNS